MKIIYQGGFTEDELITLRTTIYRNLLESAHNLILAMRRIGVDCVNPHNRVSRAANAAKLGVREWMCDPPWAGYLGEGE